MRRDDQLVFFQYKNEGSITRCGSGCGNSKVNNWIPFCAVANDILCNEPLPLPHRMGSEPIYYLLQPQQCE